MTQENGRGLNRRGFKNFSAHNLKRTPLTKDPRSARAYLNVYMKRSASPLGHGAVRMCLTPFNLMKSDRCELRSVLVARVVSKQVPQRVFGCCTRPLNDFQPL